MKWSSWMLCCIVLFLSGALPAQEGLELTVRVTGAEPTKGSAVVSLFTSKADFLKNPLLVKRQPIDNKGEATVRFGDIKAGEYAVSVVYDKDGNGELNTNFLGIPVEPVGFSNNPKGRFGPPGYNKAVFPLRANRTITINLVNVKD